MTQENLVAAMRSATEKAYKSVPAPVEGTILTVVREISAARTGPPARTICGPCSPTWWSPATRPWGRTPGSIARSQKGRGGGFRRQGAVLSLRGHVPGHHRPARGQGRRRLPPQIGKIWQMPPSDSPPTRDKGHRDLPKIEWGFDVQFLIEKPNKSVEAIRADIEAMGDCPLVDGDEHLVKVHVHVFDPGVALSYGINLGFMTDVVVENMDDMAATAHIGMMDEAELEGLPRPPSDWPGPCPTPTTWG